MRILFAILILAVLALLWVSVAIARHVRRERRRRRRILASSPQKPGTNATPVTLDLSVPVVVAGEEITFLDPSAKPTPRATPLDGTTVSLEGKRIEEATAIELETLLAEPVPPPPIPTESEAVVPATSHEFNDFHETEPVDFAPQAAVQEEQPVLPEETVAPENIATAPEQVPAPPEAVGLLAGSPEAVEPELVLAAPELVLAAIEQPDAESAILEQSASTAEETPLAQAQAVSESSVPVPPPPRRPFRAVPPKHPLASLIPPIHRPDWAYFNKDMGDLSDPAPRAPRLRPTNQE